MTKMEWSFLLILFFNTLGAVIFELCNEFRRKKTKGQKMQGRIWAVILCITPIVGGVFLCMSHIVYRILFRTAVDLEDVIFSKERVQVRKRSDVESERNIVPIEEAVAISDKYNQRTLLMNVARGEVRELLASISLALNSEDTETAHYAAAVLRDVLNEFQEHVQLLYNRMSGNLRTAIPIAVELINYMHNILMQNVFHKAEQKNFVDIFDEACTLLFDYRQEELKPNYIEWMCLLLMDLKDYRRMEYWCERGRELYPNELSTYTCYLKLYFSQGKREMFFKELENLRSSSVVIDRETLELIRTFQ